MRIPLFYHFPDTRSQFAILHELFFHALIFMSRGE